MRHDGPGVLTTLAAAMAIVSLATPHVAAATIVAALCPDVGESPAVFATRDRGEGLAQRLERAGYEVVLVDPWAGHEASQGGFDAVVEQVYPFLVDVAAGEEGEVVWIGHGLCGLLPAAAAARGQAPDLAGWVALGTRFDYRFVAPAVTAWLAAWKEGNAPSEETRRRALLTGPPTLGAEQLYRDVLERRPPAALIADLERWHSEGTPTARDGLDYLAAIGSMRTPALLVAGASDPFAPPEDVLPAVEPLGASYRMLSRVNGHGEEFGHAGMLISRRARRGVDPVVTAWLQGRRRLP